MPVTIFTTSEANASKIVRMEKVQSNGTHEYWVFGIKDNEGNYIDWQDYTLSSSATKSNIKTRIIEYLTGEGDFDGVEKSPAKPIIISDSIINKGLGETLG
jgi:hypothetical protein